MFPVFSLVLDEDVPADIALIYPELYKDLSKVGNKCFPSLVTYVFYYFPFYSRLFSTKTIFKIRMFVLFSTGQVTLVQDFLYLGSDQYISR